MVDRMLDFLARCQDPTGGFGGGPGQHAHTAPTFAAVNSLAILGKTAAGDRAYKVLNRERLYDFWRRMKQKNGGFSVSNGGEVDTRGTYTVVAAASLTNLLTPELSKGTAEFIASCQRYEGGIGGEPGNEAHGGYTYCGLAALILLGRTDAINLPRLLRWATQRQMVLEGGFQGRTNKLVDGCYSFWVGALFPLVDLILRNGKEESSDLTNHQWLFHEHDLQKYVLVCGQFIKGGLRDKPGKHPDFYHTCYCLSGLSVAQHTLSVSSPVLGLSANELRMTNPLYNITVDALPKALDYFAKQSVPSSSTSKVDHGDSKSNSSSSSGSSESSSSAGSSKASSSSN